MPVLEEITAPIKVVKRNGKKVDFNGPKIALAIKKGFDSITIYNEDSESFENKYNEKDIQKIYQSVIKRIEKEYHDENKIKMRMSMVVRLWERCYILVAISLRNLQKLI